jgi:hypothetical protein
VLAQAGAGALKPVAAKTAKAASTTKAKPATRVASRKTA